MKSIDIRIEGGEFEAGIFEGEECVQRFPLSAENLFNLRESVNRMVIEAIVACGRAPAAMVADAKLRSAAPALLKALRDIIEDFDAATAELNFPAITGNALMRAAREIIAKLEDRRS